MAAECVKHSATKAGLWSGHVTHKKFGGSNHITGTAEPKVVKCCTQVGYINSSNRMIYHPQEGSSASAELLVYRVIPRIIGYTFRKPATRRRIVTLLNDLDLCITSGCLSTCVPNSAVLNIQKKLSYPEGLHDALCY